VHFAAMENLSKLAFHSKLFDSVGQTMINNPKFEALAPGALKSCRQHVSIHSHEDRWAEWAHSQESQRGDFCLAALASANLAIG
jgi:hypothetical protein